MQILVLVISTLIYQKVNNIWIVALIFRSYILHYWRMKKWCYFVYQGKMMLVSQTYFVSWSIIFTERETKIVSDRRRRHKAKHLSIIESTCYRRSASVIEDVFQVSISDFRLRLEFTHQHWSNKGHLWGQRFDLCSRDIPPLSIVSTLLCISIVWTLNKCSHIWRNLLRDVCNHPTFVVAFVLYLDTFLFSHFQVLLAMHCFR